MGPKTTNSQLLQNNNTVVSIPADFPLSDSEKSVLSKGLNFVPIAKRTDEFAVKQDVEKFIRRVQLKAFFHNKEDISRTSEKNIFETINVRKSKWTPPKGQFTSSSKNAVMTFKNSNSTVLLLKCSNLSNEEWAALKDLNKRKDIVIEPADKGGAVVVWRSDLYEQEAFRQLSDKSFYAKVDKDFTLTNQKLVKETIQDLISKQELPDTA